MTLYVNFAGQSWKGCFSHGFGRKSRFEVLAREETLVMSFLKKDASKVR